MLKRLPQEISALLKEFTATLKVPKKRSPRKIIVAPFGPSCVGKTTVMKYIARRLPLVHIEHDALRLFLRYKGIDENKYLYKYELIHRVVDTFLARGFSVIVDANFATSHRHVPRAEQSAKRYGAKFFLIRVTAPRPFVVKKLKRKRFLPTDRGGLFPDAKTGIEHFDRSLEHFNYERLTPRALAVVDSSKPLASQLKGPLRVLRATMRLK